MKNFSAVFKVGTRKSPLALIQTRRALDNLQALLTGIGFQDIPLDSPGDRDRQTDLRDTPGNFFTRDLDEAVLDGSLDAAVHSAKDMPDPVPPGLDWCWLPWREDPRDAIILAPGKTVEDLFPDGRIGVSSDRREQYCRDRFPTMQMACIRGNIEHRLEQLDRGDYDMVIMAGAALVRLGLEERITEWISLEDLPTPAGQGVLGMSFRAGDPRFEKIRSLMVTAVTFVGSGPGNTGLITRSGVEALQRCDVCLYDSLSDSALLDLLPPLAERVNVGKRCGQHTVKQDEITDLITVYARRGGRVVRLKGGDPGVFGRLAEEVEALDALALPYRVIPGVSSLNAATTGTGMLLTRRGLSRGFTAMTPRCEGGGIGSVDAESRGRLPLAFFMAVGSAGEVSRQLQEDGRWADEPAAMVFNAGGDNQTIIKGTLSTIAEQVAAAEQSGPGLFLVGAVTSFGFRQDLGALAGKRVLLTCSEALQEKASGLVWDFGGVPVKRSLIRLTLAREAVAAVARCAEYDWLVLTSPVAVRCFMQALAQTSVDIRSIPKLMVCGPGTGRELADFNIKPDAVPEQEFSAEGLIQVARTVLQQGDLVLRLRSDRAGTELLEQLRQTGAEVDDMVLYRNEPVRAGEMPPFDAVFIASTSAVAAFLDQWGKDALAGKTVVAIGKPTAAALANAGVANVLVPQEATVEASLHTLAAHWVANQIISGGNKDQTIS